MNFSTSSGYGNFSLKLENCAFIEAIVLESKVSLANDITFNVSPQGSKLKVVECNYYTKTRWPQRTIDGDDVFKYVIRCYKPVYGMYLHLITNMDLPMVNITIFGKKLGRPSYKLYEKTDDAVFGDSCNSLSTCSRDCTRLRNCTGFTFPNGKLYSGYSIKTPVPAISGVEKLYEMECEIEELKPKCYL